MRSTAEGEDEALLLYFYEKSSQSRGAKCYDCISMGGGLVRDSSEPVPSSERELLSRSTEQICAKGLSIAGTAAATAPVVRTCRSQENYFELSDMICVDIDIDENLASSVRYHSDTMYSMLLGVTGTGIRQRVLACFERYIVF